MGGEKFSGRNNESSCAETKASTEERAKEFICENVETKRKENGKFFNVLFKKMFAGENHY